ncbi:MAG: anthranilate synthase component II [bacterium]
MILLIDNYDSFTYNLVQYIEELGEDVVVFRNDAISIEEIKRLDPSGIVISPGPSSPEKAGISVEVVKSFYKEKPILGVCLGHQAIGYSFGGKIRRANIPVHGKVSLIYHKGKDIYKDVPNPFQATRYHSLIVTDIPPILEVSSWTEDNIIMGIRLRDYPVFGVQFHPESCMTEYGKVILNNFLAEVR